MSKSHDSQAVTRVGSELWIQTLYDDLHRLATSYLRDEPATVSLSPTVLIHELYLRMPTDGHEVMTRSHFFALAAKSMRHILVDQARHRKRKKRGGEYSRKHIEDWNSISITDDEQVLAIDEALQELHALDERQARIVELRFFAGMTVADVAEQLQLSKRTVEADWTMAKAWLRRWFDSRDGVD